jgi:thiamine-phosphate pyrophosphorylase
MSTHPCQLYLITPPSIVLPNFLETCKKAFDGGAIAALQLRLKDTPEGEIQRAAEALLPLCRAHDTVFLINDNPALAKAVGADGVHLGDEDMPLEQARALLGQEALIGVSCYDSTDRAMSEAEKGADYVAFGAFYPTTTKIAKGKPTLDLLANWTAFTEIPTVAIGGITPDNGAPLIEAGADFIAVVSAVWNHPQGPKAAVQAFHQLFASTRAKNVSLVLGS